MFRRAAAILAGRALQGCNQELATWRHGEPFETLIVLPSVVGVFRLWGCCSGARE